MNNEQIQGKWKQLSGSFREQFGRFTNDDVAQMTGAREQLIGKLEENYGDTKEEAERRYNEWSSTLHTTGEKAARTSKAVSGSRS